MKIQKCFILITGVISICSITFSALTLTAKAEEYDISTAYVQDTYDEEYESIYNEVLSEYENDTEFKRMKEKNYSIANEYIESIVEKRLGENTNSTKSVDSYGNYAYRYVTLVKQSTTSNCSAATLLQTMYGLGKAENIYGSTNKQKMATLYNYSTNKTAPGARIESKTNETLYVYEITTYLNKQLNSRKYQYRLGTNITLTNFKSYIWDSLVYNRPVLLHAKTKYLSYYNSNNLAHYLSVDYYNRSKNTVRIVDCNYDSKYYGIHTNIPVREAWYCINKESNRYMISY